MKDNKLLDLLKITCEVIDQQQVGRKFDSHIRETSGPPENKTNTTNVCNVGATNNCINMPDYFRSSTNREADKEANSKYIDKENTQ